MPVYEYYCVCGIQFSVERSIHDAEVNPTCNCGEQMKRSFFAAPIVFKGSGFYRTDKNG